MGYESRVYVIERKEYVSPSGKPFVFGSEVACFHMCVMGKSFVDLFEDEIDYDLYFSNSSGEETTRKDFYGAVCKHASIGTVREWLRNQVEVNDYRRLRPLLGFLESIDESEWDELQVVHFGY